MTSLETRLAEIEARNLSAEDYPTDDDDVTFLLQALKVCRDALQKVAVKDLQPFCPELYDDPVEVILEDTRIAREALAEVERMAEEK